MLVRNRDLGFSGKGIWNRFGSVGRSAEFRYLKSRGCFRYGFDCSNFHHLRRRVLVGKSVCLNYRQFLF